MRQNKSAQQTPRMRCFRSSRQSRGAAGFNRSMMKIAYFVPVLMLLFTGCSDPTQVIAGTSVSLDQTPLSISLSRPLRTPYHFNMVCIQVSAPFHIDDLSVRNAAGKEIHFQASLTTIEGAEHLFKQVGVLNGKYIFLVADPSQPPGCKYRSISIVSSEPFQTGQIFWTSTDKL